jgi:two-component system chemotaxis sensor kinase CheA
MSQKEKAEKKDARRPKSKTVTHVGGAINRQSASATSIDAVSSLSDLSARLNQLAARLVQAKPGDVKDLNAIAMGVEGIMPDSSEKLKLILIDLRTILADAQKDSTKADSGWLTLAGGLFNQAVAVLEDEMENRSRKSVPLSTETPEQEFGPGSDALADDPAIVEDFVVECREFLTLAEQSLLKLEKNPFDVENIDAAMRAFHTIKGSSAFLEMGAINRLAHTVESVLAGVRDGALAFDKHCGTLLLKSVDILSDIIQILVAKGSVEIPSTYDGLMKELAGMVQKAFDLNGPPAGPGADEEKQPDAGAEGQSRRKEAVDEAFTRVKTRRLDRLIDMVGELVIAHSMVNQDPLVNYSENHELSKKVGQAGKIIRELHDLSMSMRMIPLKSAFRRLNRLVRDLSVKNGKQVRLEIEGEETEIDRNMVDVINEPLVHMLRNAIDHGLEPAGERIALGKPAEGRIKVKACYEGSNVVIEMADDGRGLDRDKIWHKAAGRGLVSKNGGATDEEIADLIFTPGLSTSDSITDVSGRGIGMDVVKRCVESLKGAIEIRSKTGKGCTVIIRIPLTLAVTEGMLIRVGTERYVIPTMSIHISLRPTQDMVFTVAGKRQMVLFQDRMIPVIRLNRIFGIDGGIEDITRSSLMIVGKGIQRYAVMVDEILGKQQVVEKGLGGTLAQVAGIAGGAILGDGQVGLILDVNGLIDLAASDNGSFLPKRPVSSATRELQIKEV